MHFALRAYAKGIDGNYAFCIEYPMTIDIQELRRRLGGISQAELGEMLGGISQSTVSRLETGEIPADGPVGVLLRQLNESSAPSRIHPTQDAAQ